VASRVAQALLRWYAKQRRDLPWRRTRDPYAVWVSEIMLQQTRVEAVIPYFERWMERFPTVEVLAGSSQNEVLALWEGLGYYRRALNLRRAARIVMQEHGGRLPEELAELERLPGVGRYTAAAIGSIAFGADAVALDGNLRRVLARLSDLRLDPHSRQGERRLMRLATSLLPLGSASAFNQALMDLGSTVCTVHEPVCGRCPLRHECLSLARGTQDRRPIRPGAKRIPAHTVTAAVLRRSGRVFLARRPEGKLLGGLWEFPGGKCKPGEPLGTCLRRELQEELGIRVTVGREVGAFRHAYTHFRVEVHAFECRLTGAGPRPLEHSQIRWVSPADLEKYPMGKVDRAISRAIVVSSRPRAKR
jgi:A/G-specific adenine glycosylase